MLPFNAKLFTSPLLSVSHFTCIYNRQPYICVSTIIINRVVSYIREFLLRSEQTTSRERERERESVLLSLFLSVSNVFNKRARRASGRLYLLLTIAFSLSPFCHRKDGRKEKWTPVGCKAPFSSLPELSYFLLNHLPGRHISFDNEGKRDDLRFNARTSP